MVNLLEGPVNVDTNIESRLNLMQILFSSSKNKSLKKQGQLSLPITSLNNSSIGIIYSSHLHQPELREK